MSKPTPKGKGKVFAEKFVQDLMDGKKDFQDYVELFDIPENMLLSYRLCDCSQYKNGKLELATIVSSSFVGVSSITSS